MIEVTIFRIFLSFFLENFQQSIYHLKEQREKEKNENEEKNLFIVFQVTGDSALQFLYLYTHHEDHDDYVTFFSYFL